MPPSRPETEWEERDRLRKADRRDMLRELGRRASSTGPYAPPTIVFLLLSLLGALGASGLTRLIWGPATARWTFFVMVPLMALVWLCLLGWDVLWLFVAVCVAMLFWWLWGPNAAYWSLAAGYAIASVCVHYLE